MKIRSPDNSVSIFSFLIVMLRLFMVIFQTNKTFICLLNIAQTDNYLAC